MKKIAYSFGMFDLLHYGHVKLVDQLQEASELVIIGVLSDKVSEQMFGYPLSSLKDRVSVMNSLKNVDEVLIQNEINPLVNLQSIQKKYPNSKITFHHSNQWLLFLYEDLLIKNHFFVMKTEYSSEYSNQRIKEIFNSSMLDPTYTFIGSKGETILRLRRILKQSKIEPLFLFSRMNLLNLDKNWIQDSVDSLDANKLVVRSSSNSEDGVHKSNAGKYTSILDVSTDIDGLISAINEVFNSYDSDDLNDHVIIQRMTTNSTHSGVIFTRDLRLSSPYYIINYSESSDTTIVTSGKAAKKKVILKGENNLIEPWMSLLNSVKEIESLFINLPLDIEFSITKEDEIIIHQVRPLVVGTRTLSNFDSDLTNKLRDDVSLLFNNQADLYLSDMSFWNPSEIIGSNAYPMAYSLYDKLITRKAWNQGISELGYSKVDLPLMVRVGNKPYINLQHTFISLTPEGLKQKIKKKLALYYLNKLKTRPYLHDKVEFELILNSYNPMINDFLDVLPKSDFDSTERKEIFQALISITKNAIVNFNSTALRDEQTTQKFLKKLEKYSKLKNPLISILKLLELTERTIAVIFSRQARFAFISKSILDAGLKEGLISQFYYDSFLSSINSITTMYLNDRSSLLDSKITQEQFLIKYGHLRSGTYDITSLPYSKNIEFAIGGSSRVTGHIETNNAELLLGMKPLLDRIAMDLSIENVDLIFEFLQEAIGARENYKFIYSKAVSEILEKIVDFGTIYGLNRRDLQFITIEDISHIATMESPIEVRDFLNVTFKGRRDIYNLNSKMILPEIVFEENDFYTFDSHSARPNYVTNKSVKSQTIYLDSAQRVDLKGKIIIIENADPGYDWIFNHGIVGLITKYGGAASHMSIRCSELGVPAAIGTGELLFDKIVLAKELLLDAKNQKIEVFQ